MAGLRKAKVYDWKDSNMSMVGSDEDRQVKKSSAETEKAWSGCGQEVGVQIWRIEKFKVIHWPKDDYGKFYNGDSYIILNTYKEPEGDEIKYDVHFWIGKHSTQDEYGTAAYKTVELDTLLDDKPVQHREVEGNESELFKSYFNTMTTMAGGCDSGFRHVKVQEYKPRLLHFCKQGRKVKLTEVPFNKDRLNSGDVFIIDSGSEIIQWNGQNCSKDEKFAAMGHVQQLESERKVKGEVVDEIDSSENKKVIKLLEDNAEEEDEDEKIVSEAKNMDKELFRLSDASGKMEFTKVETEVEGVIPKSALNSNDVFILDLKTSLYIWIGSQTSPSEKQKAMSYAHNYLQPTDHPLVPVTCLKEGQETATFNGAFN